MMIFSLKNLAFQLLLLLLFLFSCQKKEQQAPAIAQFEAGNISTSAVEYALTFSPSGTELFFVRSSGQWGKGNGKSAIYLSTQQEGKWSPPVLAPFSGEFNDSGPHLSQDGQTMYFISNRPSSDSITSSDIWVVQRQVDGSWGDPEHLPAPINSPAREYSPRTDAQGNLYFASDRAGGLGQGDLYWAKWENGAFSAPVNLGKPLNSPKGEWNLEINAAGDVLIFEASEQPENVSPYGDLYISFRMDSLWSVPQHMKDLNTSGSDLYPHLINEDKTLFYTSSDSLPSTVTNLYMVDVADLLQTYKRKAIWEK